MSQHPRHRPFSFSKQETRQVGQVFKDAHFNEAGLIAALGVKGIPALRNLSAEEALERTAMVSAQNTLIRLFVIGVPVPAEAIGKAFPGLPLDGLLAGGLLEERHGSLFAAIKITPIHGLLIAFDRSWIGDKVEAPDHVMGPSDTARMLASLIIRADGGAALDIGSGCGYLAFLASKTNKRVIATDLNPRAAAFVEFNAAINGIENVEARTGNLFQPVEGEQFDLIISNPPFVISPEDRLIYLNGGMPADAFCKRIAAEAPAYLVEGGSLQMLCNWVEKEGTDWQQGLEEWFIGSGCDTWVIRSSTTDPILYAKNWMRVGRVDADVNANTDTNTDMDSFASATTEDGVRLERWLDYYRQENIASIGAGTVTMRKRSGVENWYRAFDGPRKIAGPCGDIVSERMQALDFLARHAKEDQILMVSVFRMSEKMRFSQEGFPADGHVSAEAAEAGEAEAIFIQVMEGFAYVEEIDDWFSSLILACDGYRTLQDAVEKAAADLGMEVDEIPNETAEIVRQLVEEGFLIPV